MEWVNYGFGTSSDRLFHRDGPMQVPKLLIIRLRIGLDMRRASNTVLLIGFLVFCLGCQSNTAVTRVPAPHTGAIGAGGKYYSNQDRSNVSYPSGQTTRNEAGESWSPRARGPIENIANNPEGRQISYEEPVVPTETEIIRLPARRSEQNRVNDTFRKSGLQPLDNPIELETPPSASGGAVLKEDGGDNWVSRQ